MSMTAQVLLADFAGMLNQRRKERKLSIHWGLEFIPTEGDSLEDAAKTQQDAQQVLQAARRVIRPVS